MTENIQSIIKHKSYSIANSVKMPFLNIFFCMQSTWELLYGFVEQILSYNVGIRTQDIYIYICVL